jgi:hypothetical protein
MQINNQTMALSTSSRLRSSRGSWSYSCVVRIGAAGECGVIAAGIVIPPANEDETLRYREFRLEGAEG